MSANMPKKLTFEELFNSTTMFYINQSLEKEIGEEVERKSSEISEGLRTIKDKDSLKQYIVKNKDALDNLTTVAGISEERFKRMVSMIRKDRGYVFGTEWSLGKIRTAMIDSPAMMNSVLDLIWDGKNNPELQKCIPRFYLENMAMDNATINKIQDEAIVMQLVKKGLEGTYSNAVGDAILRDIENEVKRICSKHGLDYQSNVRIPLLGRTASFVIESPKEPKVIIDVSYSVTTSSSQGSKKDTAKDTMEKILKERASGRNTIYINFLDGAGWIARQADMRLIHQYSDYVLNFENLSMLEDIIDCIISEF